LIRSIVFLDHADRRIRAHPNLNFIIVINPNSGPDGRPYLPDEQYQRAVPYLQGYPNVKLVGYVKTEYGKRDIEGSKNDIDLYWRWDALSKNNSTGPMGLDGVFVDEVDWEGESSNYFESLCLDIKGRRWRSGKPGTSTRILSDGWLCDSQPRLRFISLSLL